MALTRYLAELIGLYMALMGIVMIVKRQDMLEFMASVVDNRALIYLFAMLRILIGLAIVLGHNRWSGALAIVITLIGWLTLVRGIALLLVPFDTERKLLAYFRGSGPYYAVAIVALVLGTWLAYTGFTA